MIRPVQDRENRQGERKPLATNGEYQPLYQLEVCIEESLEMIGVLLGLRAVLLHFRGLSASPVSAWPGELAR